MAPLSAEAAVLVRTAKADLDTIACLPEQERREPFAAWALEHGYGAFDGGSTKKYQAWQKSVKNKFKRRLDGLGDGLVGAPPAAGSAATRELADSPQRAPTTTKAHHTPPAAQASSEQQHGAVRQRVLLPAAVGEERDAEPMPQARPPQPMPAPKAGSPQVGCAALEPNQPKP